MSYWTLIGNLGNKILYLLKYLCDGYNYRLKILHTSWPREVLSFLCLTILQVVWSGSRDPFLHYGAHAISLEWMKLDISNLVCRLNIKSTAITCYKSAVWGCIQGHVTFVKFWEITTNIAKTVQNRDIVKMEDC